MKNIKRKATILVVFIVQMLLCQGCNVFGFLASPSPFEEKVPSECELKKMADKKVLVWVDVLPGSGADVQLASKLTKSMVARLITKAGISKNLIISQDALSSLALLPSQRPAALGRQAQAGVVLYIRLENFEVLNLHSNKIYSGQMRIRAFLIDSQTEQVVCPTEPEGIVADVATELTVNGREDIVNILCDSSSHCIVRCFYACPKSEYQVNEERSTLNEMIRRDVY